MRMNWVPQALKALHENRGRETAGPFTPLSSALYQGTTLVVPQRIERTIHLGLLYALEESR